jgi:hypothetical protein
MGSGAREKEEKRVREEKTRGEEGKRNGRANENNQIYLSLICIRYFVELGSYYITI